MEGHGNRAHRRKERKDNTLVGLFGRIFTKKRNKKEGSRKKRTPKFSNKVKGIVPDYYHGHEFGFDRLCNKCGITKHDWREVEYAECK